MDKHLLLLPFLCHVTPRTTLVEPPMQMDNALTPQMKKSPRRESTALEEREAEAVAVAEEEEEAVGAADKEGSCLSLRRRQQW
mmetsp:Transcript_8771/g.17378  ORF Transcript_8771/g.17378 Transcript_8771/m.17378 type:complete len:83 (-) Transcript_8771:24-272(-)